MDVLAQTTLIVALVSIGLGVSVLSRNIRNKIYLSFAAVSLLISFWALAFFFDKMYPGWEWYHIHLFFHVWIGPVALVFMGQMLGLKSSRFLDWIIRISFVVALIFSGLLFFRLDSQIFIKKIILFAPSLVVVECLHVLYLEYSLRHMKLRPLGRSIIGLTFSRRFLILLGAMTVLTIASLDHIPWFGIEVPSIGNVLLIFYLFFLSQAVSQQRLLNFASLLSRFLVLAVMAFTLTGVYTLLFAWIENRFGLFFLNSFFLSFLLLAALDPLRRFVQFLTHRLLTQKYRKLGLFVESSIQKLSGVVDDQTWIELVSKITIQSVEPKTLAIYLMNSEGTRFRRVKWIEHGEGDYIDAPFERGVPELLVEHPILFHCERLRRRSELPVLLSAILEGERDGLAGDAQKKYIDNILIGLKALDSNLIIPLFLQDGIVGFIALWVPAPPEPWGNNWGILHLLYPFYELAAKTLEGTEVYERQREKDRLAELGEMSAGLAHEIRNPLGAIKGAAQLLDTGTATAPADPKLIKIIVEEVNRLNQVVTQFLDFSKPNRAELESIDLNLIVQKTLDLVQANMDQKIQIDFVPSEIAPKMIGAPTQIQQIVINLLQNSLRALEARESGRIQVRVRVLERTRVPSRVVLEVEDNGPGIKKEILDKIFIPFFTTSQSGTGLGLPICQKIAEAHQGRISVQSQEGEYTRFSVYFPLETKENRKLIEHGKY